MHFDGEPVYAESAFCKSLLIEGEWLIKLSGEWLC